jgi:hypothetical protein
MVAAMLESLGNGAMAIAIERVLLHDRTSLRSAAKESGINPGSLHRAEKRLARLLRPGSATPP